MLICKAKSMDSELDVELKLSMNQLVNRHFNIFHAKHSQLLKCENVMLFIFLYDSKLNMSFGVVVSEEITD